MLIKIHIADHFCENYMPFLLFRNSLRDILGNCGYDNQFVNDLHIETCNDLCTMEDSPETLVFLNMYDVTLYENKEKVRDCVARCNNVGFIIINTEHWETKGAKEIFHLLEERNQKNVAILEYNIINYKNIVNTYLHIRVLFLPLIYSHTLKTYYQGYVHRSLSHNEKNIDVLFYGGLNDRRIHILNQLQETCRVHVVDSHHGATNQELCNLIERSVVVINILYTDRVIRRL